MPVLPDLSRRRLQPEVMDQPDLDAHRHTDALRGLRRLNAWSGSVRILWPSVRELAARAAPAPLRILDIASGAGDVLCGLARRAVRAGIALDIEGWDISPRAIDFARQAGADLAVRFERHDALHDPLPDDRDVIISSLFLHHLDEDAAVALLQRMGAAARRAVLINDLARSTAGLMLAHVATRLLTLSPVVHVDGPRSVEGAFTPDEALRLAERAGLRGATVTRRWPFRYLLAWRRA
jgi:SAM-dependent methyltransferase